MNGTERRLADRFSLKIPLQVRILKSAIQEHEAESLNVSIRGIYFRTDLPLREGTPVHLIFEMPQDVTRKPASQWRCTGHVVHVQPSSVPHDGIYVGVAFDCYEVLPLAQPAASREGRE